MNPTLPPLKPDSRPALPPSTNGKPHTTRPAKGNADPTMDGHLEHAQQHELYATPGHVDKRGTKRTRRLDQHKGTTKHSPTPNGAAPDHQPEEGHVEEGDVVIYVPELTRQEDDGGEQGNGEERCVVQRAVVGARFFAVGFFVAAGRVAGQDIAVRD